ncbi:VTT domain-containing protein [Thiolapillus sp.]
MIKRWLLLAALVIGVGLAIVYRNHFDTQLLTQWVEQAGGAGPLLFVLVYAVATVLFLPGAVLTLAGGALFGPVLGTFYNLAGATLGAGMAFLIARYLASGWVEKKAAGRVQQLKEGVEKEGWRFVAFVRLVPLFPFNLLNYALGLTRLRFAHYLIASYIFMLPGAFAYTYLGYAGREAIAGGEAGIQKGLLALALLALVAFLPRLVSRFRQGDNMDVQELKERLASDPTLLLLDVRSTGDFASESGAIDSAVNLPLEALSERIKDLSAFRHKPIALICTTNHRSQQAAQILRQNGFTDVRVVMGGMHQWNKYNYPIVHN